MRREERRSLAEIEQHLVAEDPKLAQGLSDLKLRRFTWAWITSRTVFAGAIAALAVVLLILGQVGAAFLAVLLVGVVIGTRKWRVQA